MQATLVALMLLAGLAGCQSPAPAQPPAPATPPEPPALAITCPPTLPDLPAGARCWQGTDSAGAHYLMVLPREWSGVLVLHAHGGPSLGAPKAERAREDLQRWAVMVRAGHAWAGSTFAQGGVAVRAAAADTERLRQIFVAQVATPRRTLLHGQSWGAGVAAKGAEMYPDRYDAVLLSSGVLAGGTRAYDMRLDLRVVYQHLCHNHPLPSEPAYPLWMGLPEGAKLTRAQLEARAKDCLGLGLPVAQRTPDQRQRLKTLVDVLRIPERAVMGHLVWATWHFQDIALHRTGGGNVFGNIGVRYQGSADDEALNAQVLRYAVDPATVARFAADTDPNGRINVPVLSVHGIGDLTAFVEMDHQFAATMAAAGNASRLVQTFTTDAEHSYLADPVYPALVDALLAWVDAGDKPTPPSVAARCTALEARFGPGCRFVPDYRPAPLDTRTYPRQRP
jgi:pimeloyl-ACP methyl ester carboxylesterase